MATKSIGYVADLVGDAQVRSVDGVIRVLSIGDQIHEGDILTTGVNTDIVLEFYNGQKLQLGENTEILLDESVFASLNAYPDARADQLAELQSLIVEGVDLAELEATAAGAANDAGDALHSASIYSRDGDEGIVETRGTPLGFDAGPANDLPLLDDYKPHGRPEPPQRRSAGDPRRRRREPVPAFERGRHRRSAVRLGIQAVRFQHVAIAEHPTENAVVRADPDRVRGADGDRRSVAADSRVHHGDVDRAGWERPGSGVDQERAGLDVVSGDVVRQVHDRGVRCDGEDRAVHLADERISPAEVGRQGHQWAVRGHGGSLGTRVGPVNPCRCAPRSVPACR